MERGERKEEGGERREEGGGWREERGERREEEEMRRVEREEDGRGRKGEVRNLIKGTQVSSPFSWDILCQERIRTGG